MLHCGKPALLFAAKYKTFEFLKSGVTNQEVNKGTFLHDTKSLQQHGGGAELLQPITYHLVFQTGSELLAHGAGLRRELDVSEHLS